MDPGDGLVTRQVVRPPIQQTAVKTGFYPFDPDSDLNLAMNHES